MSVITPIINLKPTNLTQEDFLNKQKFGLQPYDRSPNDYLRFVAKIFTAFRDPNDNILNFDPFDDKYEVTDGTTNTTLQATADKSIIAYVDGFQAQYNFVRLTTDALSTDLTQADNVIPNQTGLVSFTTDNGDVITIDKSKYGEYHRFQIDPGICFIDNQLVQITEQTVWWFRMPEVKDIVDNKPTFEIGQFIADPLKVYSLLPNKNYKVVLKISYIIKFVKTILLDCLIGLITLILVFKLTTFEILSYICTILGLLVFIGLLIFCKEDIIEEFKKVFNF